MNAMRTDLSERRIRNNRLRRRRELRRNILTLVLTMALVVCCSVLFFDFNAKAQSSEDEILYKYYKTVSIAKDDTLWNFADEYADSRFYESHQSYIDEVMHINSLDDSRITAGCYLILPYYSAEFVQ